MRKRWAAWKWRGRWHLVEHMTDADGMTLDTFAPFSVCGCARLRWWKNHDGTLTPLDGGWGDSAPDYDTQGIYCATCSRMAKRYRIGGRKP